MEGSRVSLERLAPLSGLVFVVFGIAGVFLANAGTRFAGAPADLARHYADARGAVSLGAWLGMLGAAGLAWFAAVLWRGLRLAEGPGGRLSVAAFGGGIAAATVLLLSFSAHLAAAFRAGQEGGLSPSAAATLFDVGGLLWGVAAPVATAGVAAAVGLIALRHGAFPVWWGWISIALAVALLILPIAWVAFIAAHAWIAVVSLWMLAQEGGSTPGPGTAGA